MRRRALAAGLTYLVLCVLCVLAAACGDDEGGSDDGGAATGAGAGGTAGGGSGGTGGRQTLPDPDGGSGVGGGDPVIGDGEEGQGCATPDDCGLVAGVHLTCVNSGGFGVCARGCETDGDCGTELCDSPYTGLAEDAHCIDLVNEEFAACGGITTSLCSSEAGLTCFLYSDVPAGVCMTQCIAAADDAGVVDTVCKSDQVCVASVVSGGDGTEGVCGTTVGRGEPCGSELGKFCPAEDICAPDDPENMSSPITCHQTCARADDACDEGACLQVRTTFYCR